MSFKRLFCCVAAVCAALLSCDKNKVLIVSPETVVLNSAGDGKYLEVQAPGAWTVVSTADWVKLGMTEGNGNGTLMVSASATTAARAAVLTFSCGNDKTSVAVTQLSASEEQGGGQGGGGGEPAAAGTYTIDFTAQGYEEPEEVTSLTKDGIRVDFSNAKWYDGGAAVRAYSSSTVTVSSAKKILKIVITFGTQDKNNVITADCGTYAEPQWTGNSGKVVFTVTGDNGHRRFAKMEVTLSGDDSGVDISGGGDQGGQGDQGGGEQGGGDQGGGQSGSSLTDVLNKAFTGATSNQYVDWSGKKGSASQAVYAGNSATQYEAIQLRSKNENSGIVSTTSGGTLTKIALTWNAKSGEVGNTEARAVQVYGSNTAYSSPADLFSSSKQGTLIGTLTYGQTTQLSVSGNYTYVGLRSKENALYLDKVEITWTK